MLHQLKRYAQDHEIAVKYGFKSDTCRWLIDVNGKGDFLSLSRIDGEFPLCPKYPSNLMNAGGRTHFLLEAFNKIESDYFAKLMEEASAIDTRFNAVLTFLKRIQENTVYQSEFSAKKAKSTDKVTFSVDGQYLIKLDNWHEWWQRNVRDAGGAKQEKSGDMLCLLDGERITPVKNHAKINISRAGGISSGSVLVGFDKDAFTSYGLKASQNAAMSERAVLIYTAALNRMIKDAPRPLGNVLILHGYDKHVPPDDDLFRLMGDIDSHVSEAERMEAEDRFHEVIESVSNGKRPNYNSNRYYVFSVSGTSGRVIIRDYIEDDCVNLAKNFLAWFDDIAIVSPKGGQDAKSPKLVGLLTRLISYRENDSKVFQRVADELSPIIPSIWRSILIRTPIPDAVAQKALAHLRSRLLKTDNALPDTLACMWLKIWLIRGGKSMSKGLNKEEPSQAYHLGRMLAVYACLQEKAIPEINVTVGQRYFTAASTTPALVLGRLAALSNHHLAKLEKTSAVWYKRQIQEVAQKVGSSLPNVMNLSDQSLFALGYYHQMAEIFKGKSTEAEN